MNADNPPNPSPQLERSLQIQAWIDGELPPAEARALDAELAGNTSARRVADDLRVLRDLMREAELPRAVPDSRSFYWSQISRGIAHQDRVAERQSAPTPVPAAMRWLRWLMPAAGLVAALAFFLRPPENQQVPSVTIAAAPTMVGHEVDAPAPEVTTLTFYSAKDSATVVWVSNADVL